MSTFTTSASSSTNKHPMHCEAQLSWNCLFNHRPFSSLGDCDRKVGQTWLVFSVWMAVLESHYVLPLYFILFFQTLFSEVTERIPFILSHNIRSRCNLIMPCQKFVKIYPPQKNHPKTPKMGISETESDIRWWITSQQNFTSTIAALVHYEGPCSVNPQKRVNCDPKMRD